MNRKRAFSFVEILLVVGLSTVFLVLLVQFFRTSNYYARDLDARVVAIATGNTALRRVVKDIQEGRRLLAPVPGQGDLAWGSWLSADGQPVTLALERPAGAPPSPAWSPGRLVRRGATGGPDEVLAEGVLALYLRVPPVPTGRDAQLMHLTLVMEAARGQPIFLIASARPTAADVRCPLDR